MPNRQTIHYQIQATRPAAHRFTVICTLPDPVPDGQRLSMAAWIPGSYMVRDFARHVISLRAEANGLAVAVEKLDKQTWRCAPCRGPLRVILEIYAWDLSVRGAHLDTSHGYFNGTSVFPRLHGRRGIPCVMELLPPAGPVEGDWRVATAMTPLAATPWGFGTYQAASYDELVDHPVEMGTFAVVEFSACGVPHQMAISGRQRADRTRLARDLRRVCEHHIRFFGEPPPMDRYLFLTMAVGDGYGGLEHRASSSLMCKRGDLPQAGDASLGEGYRSFLGLCSHEYFHAWNVKRIKPAVFSPYDLSREVHTRLLWAFEGITSYYDDLALCRAGLIEPRAYLELLGQTVTRVWRGSGRFVQSVAESSFDAWTKFYRQDENAPNAIVSYYAKGCLIALALDLTLRLESGGEHSLDEVMVRLWRRYGDDPAGVPEHAVEEVVKELAEVSLEERLSNWLHGTDDPPLRELLADFGVDFQLRAAGSQADKGGLPGKEVASPARPVLGVRSRPEEGGERILVVFDGGPAQRAGVAAGDLVVAVDGLRSQGGDLDKLIGGYPVGEEIRLHVFRRDELRKFRVMLEAAPEDTCVLRLRDDLDEAVARRRDAWLTP